MFPSKPRETDAAPGCSMWQAAAAEEVVSVSDEQFLNSYHNASTPPSPDVPADMASFMLAADPILAQAAELARVITRAHQGADAP